MSTRENLENFEGEQPPMSEEAPTRERVHDLDLRLQRSEITQAMRHEENKAKLDEVLTLARKTNGRVTRLERWFWTISGAMAIIVPVVWYLVQTVVGIEMPRVLTAH